MESPRIITGKYKGLQLKVPEAARPVTDRVKKSIFDILGSAVQGTNILDLFAGSGSLGIEALSQGAASGTFVDQDSEAIDCLKANLQRIEEPYKIIKKHYRAFLESNSEQFNIIFLDPPFSKIRGVEWKAIQTALAPQGLIVFKSNEEMGVQQSRVDEKPLEALKIIESRKIGINYIYFLSPNNA